MRRTNVLTPKTPSPPRGEGWGEGAVPSNTAPCRVASPPHPTLSPGGRGSWIGALLVMLLLSCAAQAQDYPNRPIRIVNPCRPAARPTR